MKAKLALSPWILIVAGCWGPSTSPAEILRNGENIEISKQRALFEAAEARNDQLHMCRSAAALAYLRGRQGETEAYEYWLAKQHANCKKAGWNGKEIDD